MDQFLTYKKANLGPIFNFTAYAYIYIYIGIVYFGARYFSGHFLPFLSKNGLIFLDSTRHFSCRKEEIWDFGGHFLPQKGHPGPKAFL